MTEESAKPIAPRKKEFTIIRDTREQNGYTFTPYDTGKWKCLGHIDKKLETGDYSIVGLEDHLCIERKASTGEMAVNFGKDKARFMEEIDRMRYYEHKYLVLEFSFNDLLDFPKGSNIPAKTIPFLRVTGNYMIREITELQVRHGIQVVFAGDRLGGYNYTNALLRRITDLYSE